MPPTHQKESWHVGKEIPIAMLFAVAIQTGGALWWAASFSATVTAKLDSLSMQVAALTADKYSMHDAEKDQALVNEKLDNLKTRMDKMESKSWRKN